MLWHFITWKIAARQKMCPEMQKKYRKEKQKKRRGGGAVLAKRVFLPHFRAWVGCLSRNTTGRLQIYKYIKRQIQMRLPCRSGQDYIIHKTWYIYYTCMRAQLDIHKYRSRLKACSISTSWPELSCQGNRAYRENFRQKKKHGCERIKENWVFCYGQENQSKKKELFEEWEGSFLILANVSLPPFSARQQGKNYLFLEKEKKRIFAKR